VFQATILYSHENSSWSMVLSQIGPYIPAARYVMYVVGCFCWRQGQDRWPCNILADKDPAHSHDQSQQESLRSVFTVGYNTKRREHAVGCMRILGTGRTYSPDLAADIQLWSSHRPPSRSDRPCTCTMNNRLHEPGIQGQVIPMCDTSLLCCIIKAGLWENLERIRKR
jgi:hypothetical protein